MTGKYGMDNGAAALLAAAEHCHAGGGWLMTGDLDDDAAYGGTAAGGGDGAGGDDGERHCHQDATAPVISSRLHSPPLEPPMEPPGQVQAVPSTLCYALQNCRGDPTGHSMQRFAPAGFRGAIAIRLSW